MKARSRSSILVVDDDVSVADSLNLILSEAGFEISVAHSFSAALALLKDDANTLAAVEKWKREGVAR